MRKNKLQFLYLIAMQFMLVGAFTIGGVGLHYAFAEQGRGEYLVNALAACDNCHTPKGPNGYDMTRRFSGGSQLLTNGSCSYKGGNITPDKQAGVGDWSDQAIGEAITKGFDLYHRKLSSLMPYASYDVLNDVDLKAIIVYLRESAPIKTENMSIDQDPKCLNHDPVRNSLATLGSGMTDTQKRGFYIASIARCVLCHSGETDGFSDPYDKLLIGGKEFQTVDGIKVAPNITNSLSKGVGNWTDDELRNAIMLGVGRQGKKIGSPMANLSKNHFSKMSRDDVDSVIHWIRSMPVKN